MHHPLRPVLFLLIALALLSCRLAERAAQDGQTTGVPTAGPVLTAPPAGAPLASPASTQSIYYTQTFDSPTVSGWSMDAVNDDVAQVQRDLSGGAYRWRITALQDVFSWMYPGEPASLPSPYFWYEASVRLGEAPADVAYGLLFYVRDGANLVYFKVAQTGEYALLERTGGDFTDLIPASPTNALDTRPGAANRLAVENSAGVIFLYINRQEIARYALPAASGTAGLAASLFAGQSATIYFDDVMICSAKCR